MTVSETDPTECQHCHSTHIRQEEDVLDTWFSSALWPFSTLGWPDESSEDFKYFYPTDVLVTGYDIIFFWVARMIFSACEHTGKPPSTVFITAGAGRQGPQDVQKPGSGSIDPRRWPTSTALRPALQRSPCSPGSDIALLPGRCEAARNFANKIWNASRFLMMNLTIDRCELPDRLELEDKWILSKLNSVIPEGHTGERAQSPATGLGVAAQKVYDFIWDSYRDWYIRPTRPTASRKTDSKLPGQQVLCCVLTRDPQSCSTPLQLSPGDHGAPHSGDYLMLQQWPQHRAELDFPEEEKAMELIMDAIRGVRARRAEMNVPPSKKAQLTVSTLERAVFEQGIPFLKRLAYASDVTVEGVTDAGSDDAMTAQGMVTVTTHAARLFRPLAELVDLEGRARGREGAQEEPGRAGQAGGQAEQPRLCQQGPRPRGGGRAGPG